ncbi:MAG TPA: response regulator [Chloroflexota bacterium]|nr:response regulator [Chloroflexota bacterium]
MAYQVLVLEDDTAIREMIVSLLQDEGYHALSAANGLEGLEVVQQSLPDLILLDLHLPLMSGKEFANELTRREIPIPIIVVSASLDAEEWATEIGAVAWLGKPFELEELSDAVAAACTCIRA